MRVYVKNVGVTDQGWSEPSSEVRCNTQIVTDYARRAISTWLNLRRRRRRRDFDRLCGLAVKLRGVGFGCPDVLPERDGHEVAGIAVGQQVEALESRLSLSAWKLLPYETDDAVESIGRGLPVMTRANTKISFD
jgi:hypothetical protein